MNSLENFRLVVFRAVAQHHSFRRAAEELNLTQPAVSHQIKALEMDLSVALFDRTGTTPQLTEAGRLLLHYTNQTSAILLEARNQLHGIGGLHLGPLLVGASTTIAQYLLPHLMANFLKLHPLVKPRLISGNTEQIVDALLAKQIQVAFVEGPPKSRDVRSTPFLDDELVLIAPAQHEWASRNSIAPRDLLTAPLLMRERGSGTRRVVELTLKRHGIDKNRLQILMELDSTEAIKSAVEAGLGIGIVSRFAIAKDGRLGHAYKKIPIQGIRFLRKFLILERKGPVTQSSESEFIQFVALNLGAQLKRPKTLKASSSIRA